MEVKLWTDKRDREMYDNIAELYAIIKTTEKLEKAYTRDLVSSSDYDLECRKLIAQFKNLSAILRDVVPSVENFAEAYNLDCPAALNRLLVSGIPATEEHRVSSMASSSSSGPLVAECVQHFITTMDALKLGMLAVDQVHPPLADLLAALGKMGSIISPDFEGRVKIKDWIGKLSRMAAADELTEQQARQLSFDLESSYTAFLAELNKNG